MKVHMRVVSVVVLLALGAGSMAAVPPGQTVDTYLRSTIGLSAADVRRVHTGQVVATLLDGRDGREVVTFGAVRIQRSPDDVLAYLQSTDALRQGAAVEQLGVISIPASPEAFAEFVLPDRSVSGLASCRVEDCEVQLPRWAIERFRAPGSARASPGDEWSVQVMRTVAWETLQQYLRGGHNALAPYVDRDTPFAPSEEYTRLLGSAEYLPAPLTALRHSLNGFPKRQARGVADRFFWTVVDFGMKPTFRLSHMATASGPALDDPSGRLAGAIASLQLLATHYFTSTLEWHFVVRDPDDPSATYLYHLARSWSPGLGGFRGRLLRFTVRSRSRDGVEGYMAYTKRTLEEMRRWGDEEMRR